MALPSTADVNAMRKDELKAALLKLINNTKDTPSPSSMLQIVLQEIKGNRDEIKALREEVTGLKSELAVVKASTPADTDMNTPPPEGFANVVKQTVRSVFQDESVRKDVIIHLPENKQDDTDVNELCQKVQIQVKPCAITRIGKPAEDKKRPLKASFPSPFDARTFIAKVDAYKKEENADPSLARIRCRPCRTRDEQARYVSARADVKKLNDDAKSAGLVQVSYSLRSNGEVWKFEKSGDTWTRVKDWTQNKSGN